MSNNVPTILVGLGGIGSSIVNKIYGEIPSDSRDNVAIHAFDTDVNTIQKMEHLVGSITQTSTKKSVGEYLHQNEDLLTWFPDNPHVRKKNMTQGAGQIRAVSRLAFRAAMAEGKMNSLWEGIDDIFPVNSDKMIHGVRVIIISSMAGGTGSGIFLQVAMYLREMLEKKFGHSSVLIRGAFLLPDIFVRTNTIDGRQWENVRANGYACLKELNAITLSAAGELVNESDVTIDLEYRPNQVDLEGRTTHAITGRQLPFDFCFLYDYENLRGQHLSSVSQYIDQVSRTIYLQLFSPISAKHFSQEDNQIIELISSEGRGRYCGAGAATLTYPYESVMEYCALKWATLGLDEAWLKLDEIFEEERTRYERDLRRGINRERPKRGQRFIWNLENNANEESPNPLFKLVSQQVREELKDGKSGKSKAILFLDEVENRVEKTLDNDGELKSFEANCRIDDGKLKVKDNTKNEISRVEAHLHQYYEQISKKIYDFRTAIAHQIIDQDADAIGGTEGRAYQLNTWFLRKPTPIHPIAARYILYQIREELNKRIIDQRTKNTRSKEEIIKYESTFNLRETDTVETAMQRVDQALNQGFFRSLYKNELKEFTKEYVTKSARQLAVLNNYKKDLLLELVYTSILQAVETMIRDWERFFENLKDTRESLLEEINKRAVQYDRNNDQTKEYVLATKEHLEKTWESIRQSVDTGALPDEISEQIYLSHYRQYCRRNEQTYSNYMEEIKVEELYRNNVLGHCRQELKTRYHERLDLCVVQALRREAQYKGKDVNEYMKDRIGGLENLASPYIPSINNSSKLKFWGIHTDTSENLGESLCHDLFDGKEVCDDAFSKYEIVRYLAHYGLSVKDFAKFSSGEISDTHERQPGVYYEAYRRRVDHLNNGASTVTPHLDKRWHLPAFMPDLNPQQVDLDTKKNDRAFLLGMIYGWIELVGDSGRLVYQYHGNTGSKLILKSGTVVTEEFYNLHNSLNHNPTIYEEIVERAEREKQLDRRRSNTITNHQFILGAKQISSVTKDNVTNILDVTFAYETEGMGEPSLPASANRLRDRLFDEIENYYLTMYGSHREYQSKQEAIAFINELWENSSFRKITDEKSAEYANWRNSIDIKLSKLKQHV